MDKNWASATATANYFTEPLLDWFKYTQPKSFKKGSSFTSYLMTQGNIFEEKIVKLIIKKIGNTIDIKGNLTAHQTEKYEETINAMKKGYYVIFSGVLHNHQNKTFGVPDILIRSDIIDKLIVNPILDIDEEVINAPKLGKQKWHYRVIDIKYMTLMLKSDGETLLNVNHVPGYKAQLCIYNDALGETQGYTPNQAYILGRRWMYTKCGIQYFNDHCFDKLGVIDYDDKDNDYLDLTNKALKWIKACKQPAAKKWNVTKYPLQRRELYPNMCNQQETRWKNRKTKIATENNELTELWHVGKKNRFLALDQGINNWKDKRLNAEVLGVNGNTGRILDEIIKINQGKKLMSPAKIENNLFDWKDEPDNKDVTEFFVDFEFRNSVFDPIIKLPIADTSVILFMIGVGFIDLSGKWIFKSFTVDHLRDDCECDIAEAFVNYIHKKSNGLKSKCWVWSCAEGNMWNNVLLKHKSVRKLKQKFEWCDLLKVFQSEPIVIKGALNFKLKNVAKAMHEHRFIKTVWDNEIVDGQEAMIKVVQAAKSKKPLTKQPIIKSVIQYNETDVKVLQEMLSYIRSLGKEPVKSKKSYIDPLVKNLKRKLDRPCDNLRSIKRRLN